MSNRRLEIAGQTLRLTNLQKVYYPRSGFSKAEVIDYYLRVAPVLLRHLEARPVTLKRYPDGVEGKSFYEKRCPSHRPEWMPTASVPSGSAGTIHFCRIDDAAGLAWVQNLGAIELHVLLSRAEDPRCPTMMAFDLDPGPPAGLVEAGRVAMILRDTLRRVGVQSWVKTSGRAGLHVYVPLNTPTDFVHTKRFAQQVASTFEKRMPQQVVSRMRKDLRPGRVFIDWSQNDQHKTTVCVYSLRATEDPSVSTPITWKELAEAIDAGEPQRLRFAPAEVLERIERMGDLFAPVLTTRQSLPESAGAGGNAAPAPENPPPADDDLTEYRRKRRFDRTPEPAGPEAPASADELLETGQAFVVQKHAASHLHYDLRLQVADTLKSWAVPKGPPNGPAQKRLAMPTEDHPLQYLHFEGVIPQGEYGGGAMIVWDTGTYASSKPVSQSLQQGRLEFELHGHKLQGGYVLVRSGADKSGRDRWLLIKRRDKHASTDEDLLEARPQSVLTGRTIEDLQERA